MLVRLKHNWEQGVQFLNDDSDWFSTYIYQLKSLQDKDFEVTPSKSELDIFNYRSNRLNVNLPEHILIKIKFTCGDCGSSQVEVKKWVDLNTDEVGDCVGEHQHDYWCNVCQENLSNDNLIELKARKNG